MSNLLIKNGRIIDPFSGTDIISSLFISSAKIAATGDEAEAQARSDNTGKLKTVDATGKWIVPSFTDLHCHIREPGFEYKERMAYTLKAAAAGGYGTICVMPNLEPVADQRPVVEHIRERARTLSPINVHIIGAITMGLQGTSLSQIGELKDARVAALSDDGTTVMDSNLMMMAMNYAKTFGLTIISHCEDLNLSKDGAMNMSIVSTELGLKGIPNAAEDIIISRDIILSELTGSALHIAHLSTEFGVELVRIAKKRGLQITAEVTPHHFSITDKAIRGFNANAKVNPPLRSERDRQAVKEGLADGTIDAIATDHAPHAAQEKEREFDLAPFGIIGLETALPLGLALVEEGLLTPMELIGKMTSGPASVLPLLARDGLKKGKSADITVIDPELLWKFNRENIAGKAENSPFWNQELKGRPVLTISKGKIIWECK